MKYFSTALAAFAIACVIASRAEAEDTCIRDCRGFADERLFDISTGSKSNRLDKYVRDALCKLSTDDISKSEKSKASLSLPLPDGLPSLQFGTGTDWSDVRRIRSESCAQNEVSLSQGDANYIYTKVLSGELGKTIRACLRACEKKVQPRFGIQIDNSDKLVSTITIKYNRPMEALSAVNPIITSFSLIELEGLPNAKAFSKQLNGKTITPAGLAISVRRTASPAPTLIDKQVSEKVKTATKTPNPLYDQEAQKLAGYEATVGATDALVKAKEAERAALAAEFKSADDQLMAQCDSYRSLGNKFVDKCRYSTHNQLCTHYEPKLALMDTTIANLRVSLQGAVSTRDAQRTVLNNTPKDLAVETEIDKTRVVKTIGSADSHVIAGVGGYKYKSALGGTLLITVREGNSTPEYTIPVNMMPVFSDLRSSDGTPVEL